MFGNFFQAYFYFIFLVLLFVVCVEIICVFHYVIEDFDFFLKGKYIDFFVFALVHMNDFNGLYFFSCKTKIGSLGGY